MIISIILHFFQTLFISPISTQIVPRSDSPPFNFTEYWWPAFRAHVADGLVHYYGFDEVTAYDYIFDNFPENGGCWCQGDRSNATKGPPPEHNPYDQICRDFHMCM